MKNLLYLFLLALLVSACQETEIDEMTNIPIVKPPTTETDGSLTGKVVNAEGIGISDVEISLYGDRVTTDAEGKFSYSNTTLFEDGTYITASKAGYFGGSRKFYATEDISYVQIQLIEKLLTEQVPASSGGIVSFETATVDLPSGDYMDIDGNPYNGMINVYATWLDPTLDATFERMPGDLTGLDSEDEVRGLISYGMIGVELEDDNGNTLLLPEGELANIRMTVPDELMMTAPSTIPLWNFDEENGTWVEEGVAQLVNGVYEGTVEHFSFWNCDVPFELVTITAEITVSGISAANRLIRITNLSSNLSRTGYTNNNGVFTGKVPKDEPLQIEVFNDCGGAIQTFAQAPLSSDTNIGTLDVMGSFSNFTVTGTVSTCGATAPGSFEVVLVTAIGNQQIETDANGAFSFSLDGCSGAAFDYYAVDNENLLISERFSLNATGSVDVGNIETCITNLQPRIELDYIGKTLIDSFLLATAEDQIFDSGMPGVDKHVVTVTILDWLSGQVSEGTFTYNDGDTEATYNIAIPEGFTIEGTCAVTVSPNLRFTGTSTDITITFPNDAPPNLTEVFFDFIF